MNTPSFYDKMYSRIRNEDIYAARYPITHEHIGCSIHDRYIECIRPDSRLIRTIVDSEPEWRLNLNARSDVDQTWLQCTVILPSPNHVTMFLMKYSELIHEWMNNNSWLWRQGVLERLKSPAAMV